MQLHILAIISFITISNCNPAFSQLNKQQAKEVPLWITKGIIYQIQPRAFTEEGTLNAAKRKLSIVSEAGATIVYLCPVFVSDDNADTLTWSPRQRASRMNNPRNPYRMKDYYHVDEEYGTDQDLRDFIAEAHRLDMKVMLDMVYFHCGSNAVFLKEHPGFIRRDKERRPVSGKWNWPELNYDNPELKEYLIRNMEYFLNDFDVDGFRCDVAHRIPLDFWETVRERLVKIRPDVGMLAEGERFEDQLIAFDINYCTTWFGSLKSVMEENSPVSDLQSTWKIMADERPAGTRFIRFIDNHDIANDSYHNRIEETWGFKAVNAAFVLNFTVDGVPFVYNGQEIADTARHSIFGKAPLDWNNSETLEGNLRFELCKKLSFIRKTESVLTEGNMEWLSNNKPASVLSYSRESNGERIISVINLSKKPLQVRIQDACLTMPFETLLEDGINGGEISTELSMDGYGYWVGKRIPK